MTPPASPPGEPSGSSGGRRLAGLTVLLAGIGLVVAGRAAFGQSTGHQVVLPPPATEPPQAATTGPSTTPSTGNASSGQRTVNGSVVDTPYGPVQVAVVFDNGKIVDVRALQTPTDEDRSVRLASLATPILRQEVLSAQSARIDTVSGATYTSEGYAESVQYAIDHRQ